MMPDNSRRFCTKQIAWLVFLVSQIACASLFAAPVITATKNDNVPAATKKPAGSTVTYKTTITNNGDVTGAGMNFTDPNVANTALTGSVKVTPIAQDDSFATVGNTQLLVNAAAGLLSNDHDPDSTTFSIKSGSVTRVSATGTANGTPGTFSVNANGSFTYAPGIGATGSERWQYIITDGDNQDCVVPGYVDFSITGRVWYVQAGAVGGKTGRSHEPFDSPAAASTAANASTDTIYVFSSGSTLNGAFILEDGQKLLGQGVDLTVGALTPFAAGVAPTLANTGGNTVTLGGSNTISGLVLGNRSGAAISGSTFGTLTVTSDVIINGTGQALNLSIGTLSATFASISASAAVNGINLSTIGGNLTVNGGLLETLSGDDFVINGGTLAVNYSGRITNTAGRSVNISNKTSSGDVTLNGRISDSGTGILLDNNDGATITLKSLGLNTGANTAFSAVNGGTVVVTDGISDGVNNDGDAQTDEADEANTLTTTTGTALNIANTNIGAAGLTFQSISVTGGSNGIVLNNTGAAGGLTVTGTGTTDGSGGTIQNTSTRGASFIGARNITLKNMNFTNAATADNPGAPTGLSLGNNTADNAAIHLDNVFNATLDNLNLNGSAEQGINGRNVTNFTLKDSVLTALGGGPDEDGIHFFNMLGTCAITNTFISGSGDDNINIQNNTNLALPPGMTATGTLAITGGNANTGVLGSGYLFGIRGTSNTAITISAVTSDNNFSGGIVADSYDTATMALEVSGSTITNNNDGIQVSASNGTTTFNIHDNLAFTGQDFACINLLKAAFSTGGTLSGSLNANPFTVANGRPTDAITVFNAGGGALNAAITNNTINYGGTQRAILIQAGQDGNGSIRTQVTGNTIDVQLDGTGNAVTGMFVQTSITSPTGDGASINAKIGGAGALRNTFTHSLGGTMAGGDIRVRQRMNGTFNLDGYGGGATDTAAVVTYLSGRNTTISSPTATAETTGFTGSATPAVPLLFASGEPEAFNFGTPDSVPSAIAWTETVRQQSAATPSTPATKAPETSREKPVSPPAGLLDQSRLDSLVTAARAQWRKSGLSAEQSAALDTVTFEVADLPGWYLGEASGPSIRIDNNAGGNGWFIDATPTEDSEFSNSLEKTDATGRVDLLTTIIHEMGHSLGLCDSYSKDQRGSVMYGFLTKGERRLPKAGEAASAVPHTHTTPHFLGAPINIANLPPGKSVVITYTVTIADPLPLGTQSLTSQGTVSGSNFADVLTDDAPSDVADPILPGNADPTVTLLDRPDTTVATLARASGSPTNANPVSWTVTFSDAIAGLTNANFLLTNIGLGGSPAISSVTPTGGAPATVWTVTASTGTSSGTLGLNLANDAALSHDVTNQPFTGPVYTIDRTAPDALIALSDTALKIGDTSLVTITFNEAVTGFTNADLTVPNGTLSSVATGDNITWTATLTPAASITDATNLITLDNTGMQDAAGNTGTGTTSSNNYAIDTARPTATIVVTDTNLTIGETSPVTITFSEPVTGFANADLTVGNGTLTAVTSGDGGVTWTATLTPTPNVTVANNVITLDNTGVQDLAGNTGTGTTNSNNYAVTSLSISIVANALSAAEGTGAGTTAFTFTVSRTGSTTGAVTMNYAVSGAAVNAADFGGTLPSGVFTIPDTQASAVLTILVSKDATREPNEAFTVTLSNPSGGYAITTATASSTIDNDDFEADLAITVTDGVTTAVPGGSVTYTITASNADLIRPRPRPWPTPSPQR